jgi:DNA-binding transcriptional LysR family regulator
VLRDGRIDVGFLRLPVQDEQLVVEPIPKEPLVAALPRRHPLAASRSVGIRSLARERYIFFPREVAPGFYDLIVSY